MYLYIFTYTAIIFDWIDCVSKCTEAEGYILIHIKREYHNINILIDNNIECVWKNETRKKKIIYY